MIQGSLQDLFGFDEEPAPKQDIVTVMKGLTAAPCTACELGFQNQYNPGFLWRGNPQGKLAIVGDMPTANDMSSRKAFSDENGLKLNKWLVSAGVSPKEVFYTYIVQCKTPMRKSKIKGRPEEQRPPSRQNEIHRCYPNRCLRVLHALPQLEVAWLLGLTAVKTVLGGEPQVKSHFGFWFGSDVVPGVAFFCMPHPRDFDAATADIKRGRLSQQLTYFRNEYLGKMDSTGNYIVPSGKILGILKHREQERHANYF